MVRLQEVIIAESATRGTGQSESPIRQLTQIFTIDGELLAEMDPKGRFTVEDFQAFVEYFRAHQSEVREGDTDLKLIKGWLSNTRHKFALL